MRNVQNYAKYGMELIGRHEAYDLTAGEARALLEAATENSLSDIYSAITKAFYMGIAVGNKMTKNDRKKAAKAAAEANKTSGNDTGAA